jgi:predicted phage tail protein
VRGWFTGILMCALSGASLAERAVQSGPEQLRALQQRMEALRDELNQSESGSARSARRTAHFGKSHLGRHARTAQHQHAAQGHRSGTPANPS